jgi:Icc-related predicted phosphoesterase
MNSSSVKAFFVSDLHGSYSKYKKFFAEIIKQKPAIAFIGGDLLPHAHFNNQVGVDDFLNDFLLKELRLLKDVLGDTYPDLVMIPGNDDARSYEPDFIRAHVEGLWYYTHLKQINLNGYDITGCAYVPPTPFRLKDWERYDVSRYADPGCIHPIDGKFSVAPKDDIEFVTISSILDSLSANIEMDKCVLLMHSPPYNSYFDRAALDGVKIEHIPLDVHVGSIALQRFIEEKQPFLTLHGHIHESSRITGHWMQMFGKTTSMSAAWQGNELALIVFDLKNPREARRLLL